MLMITVFIAQIILKLGQDLEKLTIEILVTCIRRYEKRRMSLNWKCIDVKYNDNIFFDLMFSRMNEKTNAIFRTYNKLYLSETNKMNYMPYTDVNTVAVDVDINKGNNNK